MPIFENQKLTDDEKELLKNFRNLTPENRANLLAYAGELLGDLTTNICRQRPLQGIITH